MGKRNVGKKLTRKVEDARLPERKDEESLQSLNLNCSTKPQVHFRWPLNLLSLKSSLTAQCMELISPSQADNVSIGTYSPYIPKVISFGCKEFKLFGQCGVRQRALKSGINFLLDKLSWAISFIFLNLSNICLPTVKMSKNEFFILLIVDSNNINTIYILSCLRVK